MEARLAALATRYDALEKAVAALSKQLLAGSAATSTTVGGSSNADALAPCDRDTPQVAALRATLAAMPAPRTAVLQWVPSEYYTKPLPWRRDVLGAPSVAHLCKSIVLENTRFPTDGSVAATPEYSRYYVVVFQYVTRFDSEQLLRFFKSLNPGKGNKQFNFRLCDQAVSQAITGFGHNAVVPLGMATPIPVVLSKAIAGLAPAYFWMGGGDVDCKLRMDVDEFVRRTACFVADFTVPLTEEELDRVASLS